MATLRRVRPRDAAAGPAVVATAPRPDRIRCTTCGMPVRGAAEVCWSCGADPRSTDTDGKPAFVEQAEREPVPTGTRIAKGVIIGAGVAILLVLAVAVALVALPEQGGIRDAAKDLVGRGWERSDQEGYRVDLPGPATPASLTGLDPFNQVSAVAGHRDALSATVVALTGPTGANEAALRALTATLATQQGLAVASTTPTVFAGAPSVRAQLKATTGTSGGWVEAATVGDRTYALLLVSTKGVPTDAERDRLLGSFGVTDR